jgi:hypothetical protein
VGLSYPVYPLFGIVWKYFCSLLFVRIQKSEID